MTSSERLELEIDLLEKRKQAIESDATYKFEQYNQSFFMEEGMNDDIFPLIMKQLNRDQDQLAVEIAEKKLALYDLQGCPMEERPLRKNGTSPE